MNKYQPFNKAPALRGTVIAMVLTLALLVWANAFSTFAQSTSATGETEAEAVETIGSSLEFSGNFGKIIAKTPRGSGPGQIDLDAEKGFGGIPGAPRINYVVAFVWAVWVGWIFSTIGAFGGVMAGVGHLTLFGLGAYAAGFELTNPALNAGLTDTIRASNQYLGALAALISTYSFYRMKRIVVPLGVAMGVGSVAGGLLIPWLTAGKIQLSAYIGYFGLAVMVIGGVIFYGTTARARAKAEKAGIQGKGALSGAGDAGIELREMRLTRIRFVFYGVEYRFNPVVAFIGGIAVSSISSFLGVGGGFLYVPFLTSIFGLPMFIVAGTSALAVFLSMITSIFSYVFLKGTFIAWGLVSVEMAGVLIGAYIGPKTQKYIPEIWLKRLFVVLAFYVGVRYMSKGFFGQSWLPPY